MKHEIFTIKFDKLIKVDTLFDEEQSNDEVVTYVSKELYRHEDEDDEGDLSFGYRLVIQGTYCDGNWVYGLFLVIDKNSLHKDIVDGIISFCGVEDVSELTADDILAYGGADVMFDSCTTEGEDCDYSVFDKIASVTDLYNRILFGFQLDHPVNRIGWTGWDIVKHAIRGTKLGF